MTDGTVDCIATHHMPLDFDSKVLEFEYARNGMTGLETCYSVLKTVLPGLSEKRWVELLSINPRKIFGLDQPVIDKSKDACLTIFSPAGKTAIASSEFYSKSGNSPFAGKSLQGAVHGTVRRETTFFRTKRTTNGNS